MAKICWYSKEMNPTEAQTISVHGFYAQAYINDDVTSYDLAERIAAGSPFKAADILSIIHQIADAALEEVLESNRVILETTKGDKFISVEPKVIGSITDTMVQANPEKYNGAMAATENLLKADMLDVKVVASVGPNFSKVANQSKSLKKVSGKGGSVSPSVDGNVMITLAKDPSNIETTLSGAGAYEVGDEVTVTATAATGYNFDGWYVNSERVNTQLSYTFEASESMTLTAKFIINPNTQGDEMEP